MWISDAERPSVKNFVNSLRMQADAFCRVSCCPEGFSEKRCMDCPLWFLLTEFDVVKTIEEKLVDDGVLQYVD